LVDQLVSPAERARRESEGKDLLTLQPFIDAVYDAEKIGVGAYSPLAGFQDKDTVESIVSSGRLPNGLPWTIPILLAPTGAENLSVVNAAKLGDEIGLLDQHARLFAILHLEEKFVYDKKRLAQGIYGTTDPAHPNVADLVKAGETALAGRVDLLRRLDLPTGALEWSPAETRAEFARRGWANVVAYQTRNVPHTAHEYLQRCSLEREEVDGLFVHPVLGRLKKGDYRPEVTLEAYQALLKSYYPADRVALAALTITMRYAGPNAALFLAIVRKNFGCSHYIVGRDQAGIGKYYEPYACHRIFDTHPIDVTPLRYLETFYCRTCGWMATPRTCAHPKEQHMDTSQTRIRESLSKGEPLPKEIIRPEVAEVLARGDVLLTE
jgi:sulfate adenylyltransferase